MGILMPKLASHLLLLLLASLLLLTGVSAQQSTTDKRRRAEMTADLFIRRFRETLDFGQAFDEMAVSDVTSRLRRAGEIKSIGLDESLANAIDDQTASRLYKALMNFVYLMNLHAASLKAGVVLDPDHILLPKVFRRIINNSKQLRHIYSHSIEDFPVVTTELELQKFISDLEQMSALYRKHLPRNVFSSKAYQANIRQLERERGHQFEIYEGDSYFDIPENIEVFGVCSDIFCFRFIEEDGKLKVLGLVLGD